MNPELTAPQQRLIPSRAWAVAPLVGLAVWVAAIVVVGVRSATPSDTSAVTTTVVVGGAVYFG